MGGGGGAAGHTSTGRRRQIVSNEKYKRKEKKKIASFIGGFDDKHRLVPRSDTEKHFEGGQQQREKGQCQNVSCTLEPSPCNQTKDILNQNEHSPPSTCFSFDCYRRDISKNVEFYLFSFFFRDVS